MRDDTELNYKRFLDQYLGRSLRWGAAGGAVLGGLQGFVAGGLGGLLLGIALGGTGGALAGIVLCFLAASFRAMAPQLLGCAALLALLFGLGLFIELVKALWGVGRP